METKQIIEKESPDVLMFYKHYLKKEIIKRNLAIKLFNDYKYDKLHKNYIHYLKTEANFIDIESTDIDSVISQLTELKNNLPKNTTNIFLDTEYNEEYCTSSFYVSYTEYTIEDETKCEGLALCWARDDEFKRKYQPEGKDGKRAIALYNLLKNKK